MDANELRAMQAPIKERYKSDAGRGADHSEGQGARSTTRNIACKVRDRPARSRSRACIRRPAVSGLELLLRRTCCSKHWWPAPGRHLEGGFPPRSPFR